MIRCAAYFPALESQPGSLQDLRINPGISPKNVFHNNLKRASHHEEAASFLPGWRNWGKIAAIDVEWKWEEFQWFTEHLICEICEIHWWKEKPIDL